MRNKNADELYTKNEYIPQILPVCKCQNYKSKVIKCNFYKEENLPSEEEMRKKDF